MSDLKPVVTMDEYNGRWWICLDGLCVGRLRPDGPPTVAAGAIHLSAGELRAVADFLDQLEETRTHPPHWHQWVRFAGMDERVCDTCGAEG